LLKGHSQAGTYMRRIRQLGFWQQSMHCVPGSSESQERLPAALSC
jgi:hypothetical protein